ncbi:uncharacterized protein C8A04DRAFT_40868 [Dichotomopilus funicola]|uniref:Uncharacterized protein n=1 Tax=Dichotomopilus funicola TaxID=1934379 RepID=A0AAN6UU37_9PEZI|nr:hypothetical protein C8A04DRAFT_40868 [Dichotomopilus funicola]
MKTAVATGTHCHLQLFPYCGICTDVIFNLEPTIALQGNRDSTAYDKHIGPFPFPPAHGQLIDEYAIVRYYHCPFCLRGPEFTAVHQDCFTFFQQLYPAEDALHRLWTRTAWRNPWRNAEPFPFRRLTVYRPALARVAPLWDLTPLNVLPQELIEIICDYSEHSWLWRTMAVYRFVHGLISSATPEPLTILPLSKVESWDRDGAVPLKQFERGQPASPFLVLRLTVDHDGIKRIERLAERPQYSPQSDNYKAFIIIEEKSLAGVTVQLQDRRLRLMCSNPMPFHLWNTPTPPSLGLCRLRPGKLRASQNLHAVEMDKIDGITFFFMRFNAQYGLHIHRAGQRSAAKSIAWTFPQDDIDRGRVLWVYFPLPKHDRVLHFGIREGTTYRTRKILIRTKLSGDVVIGAPWETPNRNIWFSTSSSSPPSPITLIYGTPKAYKVPLPVLGAVATAETPRDKYTTPDYLENLPSEDGFVPESPPPETDQPDVPELPMSPPFRVCDGQLCPIENMALFSWAPLHGVKSAVVFYHDYPVNVNPVGLANQADPANTDHVHHNDGSQGRPCRGILLHYHNGGARALGQCRVQVDESKEVLNPTRVAFRVSRFGAPQLDNFIVWVRFTKGSEGWELHAMEGVMKFWYNHIGGYIKVDDVLDES